MKKLTVVVIRHFLPNDQFWGFALYRDDYGREAAADAMGRIPRNNRERTYGSLGPSQVTIFESWEGTLPGSTIGSVPFSGSLCSSFSVSETRVRS